METKFERKQIFCLEAALRQVQNSEQTLEIKLQEGMPDVGRVLTAWGQPVLRSKEWQTDTVQFSGGMMVWVLYAPEDGTDARCVQGWIPFQMRWELPDDTPEGTLRLRCLPRFVDGRSTSPRKILVRAGMAAMAEAFTPKELISAEPKETPETVALLENTYPVRLMKEAGEKTFLQEEELYLPDSLPKMEQLIAWNLHPNLTDQRVLADKAVLRGSGNLHVLYQSPEGQIHSWDFELPFSQYTQLRGEYSSDARMDTVLMPTALELELRENGMLELKGGMTAQYLVTDKEQLTLVEDAYSPGWELNIQQEDFVLPAILENRRENFYGEQSVSADANLIADVQFLPDFPRQRRTEGGIELENSGQFQLLYYGENGRLQASGARWEGKQTIPADAHCAILAAPVGADAQAVVGNGKILLKQEIPMELTTTTQQRIPMVTGVELGRQKQPDPNRPSLILRRAGDSSLWELAKANASTMEAIRRANGLAGEPVPEQMLLIPVP